MGLYDDTEKAKADAAAREAGLRDSLAAEHPEWRASDVAASAVFKSLMQELSARGVDGAVQGLIAYTIGRLESMAQARLAESMRETHARIPF